MHTEGRGKRRGEGKGKEGREGGNVKEGEMLYWDTFLSGILCWGNNSDLPLIIGAGKIAQLVSAFFASMGT